MSRGDAITDKSDLRKYRIEIPNLIAEMGLSVYAFRLYVHIKRVAGESQSDDCQHSTRSLARACRMSIGQVSKAKRELCAAEPPLLQIRPGERGQPDACRVCDIG